MNWGNMKLTRQNALSIHLRRISLVAACVLIGLAPKFAEAMSWDSGYGASLTIGSDDNFRLRESDELDTETGSLSVSAQLEGSSEISSLVIGASANADSYSESEIDDSEGYRLFLLGSRSGERLSTSISLASSSQSTTQSELLDTGNTEDGDRITRSVTPSLTYQVNERNSITLSLSHRDVSYDTVSLIEYTDNSASVSWGYDFDETKNISFTLRESEYDPEDSDTSETTSISVGYRFRPTELFGVFLSVGVSELDRPDESEDSNDYSLELSYQVDERNNFVASFENSYQASGAGEVREEDQLSLVWNRSISERTSMSIQVDSTSNDDRDYMAVLLQGIYNLSETLNVSASIRQREQDSGGSIEADSTSLFFTLSYSSL